MLIHRPLSAVLLALTLAAGVGAAQDFWPGADYDPTVPTFEEVLGHSVGERITACAEILQYLEALQQARPQQVRVFEYARSWEGRPLVYAIVGSQMNLVRLEEIRANRQRLADPRITSEAEARALIDREPAITWLAYGVHGNEISSPDAGLLTAYHLLAEGLEPSPHRAAAERDEPWPGGRTNHYLFDLNRDWLALTQPETRGHAAAIRKWHPQIVVDLHEMSGDSTHSFAPEAVPYNPHITASQRRSLKLYGRNNTRWFDGFGFLDFTREIFDAFYPGYGASWPLFQGSIATTYEQASTRGLVYRRQDGSDLHFLDAVRHHFVASIATAETTARHRRQLLEDFREYRRSAIEEGAGKRFGPT